MTRLRVLSGREVCRILEAHGFREVRRRGSHVVMQLRSETGTRTVPIPDHPELRIGTLRSIIRLASEPVFSMEQFSLGGYATVRGYREHQLVRDNGFVSSLELRIPLWRDTARRFAMQVAPFGDIGRSWNTNREEAGLHTLSSVGVGLRAEFRNLRGEITWAHRFRTVEDTEEGSPQNEGINFAVAVSF